MIFFFLLAFTFILQHQSIIWHKINRVTSRTVNLRSQNTITDQTSVLEINEELVLDVTENALKQLLKNSQDKAKFLRIGVKSGGCSGVSSFISIMIL